MNRSAGNEIISRDSRSARIKYKRLRGPQTRVVARAVDASRFMTNKCLNDTSRVYNGLWAAGLKSYSKQSKCETRTINVAYAAQSGRVVKVEWVYLEAETIVNNANYYYCGNDIARTECALAATAIFGRFVYTAVISYAVRAVKFSQIKNCTS